MKLKVPYLVIWGIALTGCFGDSEPSNGLDLSREECAKIGGQIVEGIGCAQEIPADEMQAMCENNGMKYSKEFNGCIE